MLGSMVTSAANPRVADSGCQREEAGDTRDKWADSKRCGQQSLTFKPELTTKFYPCDPGVQSPFRDSVCHSVTWGFSEPVCLSKFLFKCHLPKHQELGKGPGR